MPVVYIDVLFAVNFLLNYILLRAAGFICRTRPPLWRTAVGAALGAAYAIAVFFPELGTLDSFIFKLLASLAVVCAAFPIYSVGELLKLTGIFYGVSLVFGGLSFAAIFMTGSGAMLGAVYSNGVMYLDLPLGALFLGAASFYICVCALSSAMRLYRRRGSRRKLMIELGGRRAMLTALADTGNILLEPISRAPVIVAELEALKELFDIPTRLSLSSDNLQESLGEITALGLKARLIPFSSVGEESGLMVGFVPDLAAVREGGGFKVMESCIVGVYPKALSADRSYDALYNPN